MLLFATFRLCKSTGDHFSKLRVPKLPSELFRSIVKNGKSAREPLTLISISILLICFWREYVRVSACGCEFVGVGGCCCDRVQGCEFVWVGVS